MEQTVASLQLAVLSDTHELHRELRMPSFADLLCCCGDWTMMSHSMLAVLDFNDWLNELPYRHKILVPGNHEVYLAEDRALRSMTSSAIMLINEGVEIDGVRIWGSPIIPSGGGAFCVKAAEDRRRIYDAIPTGVDILITHSPAFGILDEPPDGPHCGDPELTEALRRIRPRLHLCGHIHGARGMVAADGITHLNAAMLTSYGDLVDRPFLMRMKMPK